MRLRHITERTASHDLHCFRYQSGFQPPGDVPFEDLSKADTESTNNSQINAININTIKGTISANKLKKRVGIFNIFSSNKVSRCSNQPRSSITLGGMKHFLILYFYSHPYLYCHKPKKLHKPL